MISDFEVGHNKPFAKGGEWNINNLRPICRTCNRSMRTMTIEEFKKKFFGKKERKVLKKQTEAKRENVSTLNKKAPMIEEFEDGSFVFLQKDLLVPQKIMLSLYHYYPKRVSNADLTKCVKSQLPYVNRCLGELVSQSLVHETKDGFKLTRLGKKHVEDEILAKTC